MTNGTGSGDGAEGVAKTMERPEDERGPGGRRPQARKKSPAAFRTISEVSRELDVPQHVLRFWETKFSQIRPMKRGGGRRYYRPEDITLLRGIKAYLYADGYTIRGVQKLLKDGGVKALISRASEDVIGVDKGVAAVAPAPVASRVAQSPLDPISTRLDARQRAALQSIIDDLIEIQQQLKTHL